MIDRPSSPITPAPTPPVAPEDRRRREWCLTVAGGLAFAGLPLAADRLFVVREGWMLLKTDR